MPESKVKKTYLENVDQTGLANFLRFLHSGHYSPLVRSMRYTLSAICGDETAEVEARLALDDSKALTDESLFSLEATRALILERLNKREWTTQLLPYLRPYNTEGLPFAHFERDPAPVSQLKKIINALYHTEEALKVVESIDFEGLSLKEGNAAAETLAKLLGPFAEHVYALSMLTTHPDIDLKVFFGDEWEKINGFLFAAMERFPQLVSEQGKSLNESYGVDFTSKKGVAKQLGQWSGSVLEHLRPTRDLNYATVSYFSADVSTYLNRLTQFIQNSANTWFSASYLNQDPGKIEQYEISKTRLNELNVASVRLSNAFKSLNSGIEILQPLNAYALVAIVRNTVTLLQGIIDESGHFRAESEELMRLALAQLKYEVFLELMKSLDKLEEESLMNPGTLSSPMLSSLDEFYTAVFHYVSGFVDLSVKGQDLSCLIDSRFIALRQEALFARQADREKELLEHELRGKIAEQFFNRLNQHRGKRLIHLQSEEKNELLRLFSFVQPLIAAEDITLSNIIADGLLPQEKKLPAKAPLAADNKSISPKGVDLVWHEVSKVASVLYGGFAYAYDFVDRDILGHHDDRVEFLDEGYTLELRSAYLSPNMLSCRHLYVSALNGKIVLTVKKSNEIFAVEVATPFDAPSPLSLDSLKTLEPMLFEFARSNPTLLLRPSLSQKIKHKIEKEKATCAFRSNINEDCRQNIYKCAGALRQHLYPNDENVYQNKGETSIDIDQQDWLTLYRNGLIARKKFDDARKGISRFFELLEKAEPDVLLQRFSQKNELRHLYTMIQPYLITTLRKMKSAEFASKFDRQIIDSFDGRRTGNQSLSVKAILDLKSFICDDFESEEKRLLEDLKFIQNGVQKQIKTTAVDALMIENPFGDRRGYLIQDRKYTNYVKNLETRLNTLTEKLFSCEIQKKLNKQDPSLANRFFAYTLNKDSEPLPFPEGNPGDLLEYFKQEKQILALKQVYNVLHSLKEAAVYLEELNEDSYWMFYVGRVVVFEEALRKAALLLYELKKDPYLSSLMSDIYSSLDNLRNALKTLSIPYAPDKSDKDSNREEVRDVIFYIVNGLVVAREQIDAWQKGNYISEKAAQDAQHFGEDVSEKIRNIVESNSYLQWVLKSGTFYQLFNDVKKRWNQFAASSTDAIEANLQSIYTENFAAMLVQADEWERKLGLKPGLVSEPLKEILDAYYVGMVEVLKRDASHEISLITTQLPLKKRLEKLSEASQSERKILEEANLRLKKIQAMKKLLADNPEKIAAVWSRTTSHDTSFLDSYNEVLSLLKQVLSNRIARDYLKSKDLRFFARIPVVLMEQPFAVETAELCQKTLQELLDLAEASFEGDVKTAMLSVSNCRVQNDYLRNTVVLQENLNDEKITEIIKKLISKQLIRHKSNEKMLFKIGEFYDQVLSKEIDSQTLQFLEKIDLRGNLERQVDVFLDEKVHNFDASHLSAFRQLDALQQALAELDEYLNVQEKQLRKNHSFYKHTWALETHVTLADKRKLSADLKATLDAVSTSALSDGFGIQACIMSFKLKVEDPRFVDRLLRTEEHYKISPLSWLVNWFVGVLYLFGIYKSNSQVIHEHLLSLSSSDDEKPTPKAR